MLVSSPARVLVVPLGIGCTTVLGVAPGDVASRCLPRMRRRPFNPCAKDGANTKYCNGKCVYVDDPAYGSSMETCVPCIVAHASAVCRGSACATAQCMDDYGDCDGNPANGCEYELPNDGDTCK